MIFRHRILFFAVTLCVSALSLSYAQSRENRFPRRIISAEDIKKAGDDRFKLVLHYLMPDLFPKTEQGWFNKLTDITFYVDDDRCEQEDLDDLDPQQVKRIVIWEKRWEPAPLEFPDLAQSRYIVRIETL
jgi:hypothetical protein